MMGEFFAAMFFCDVPEHSPTSRFRLSMADVQIFFGGDNNLSRGLTAEVRHSTLKATETFWTRTSCRN